MRRVFSLNSVAAISMAIVLASCTGGAGTRTGQSVPMPSGANAARQKAAALVGKIKANMLSASQSLMAASRKSDVILNAAQRAHEVDFSKANCVKLTEAQLENYVDPRVEGRARTFALRDMRVQPFCHRENVEGIAYDNTPYSNTWEGLQEVTRELTHWKPLGNGQYYDREGERLTPTQPGPHQYAGTGAFYKYLSPSGHSAVLGMVQVPVCGSINKVAT